MARIVTVYRMWRRPFRLEDMSHIRWLKISEALAALGHEVDIATNEPRWLWRRRPLPIGPNLRRIDLARVDWTRYDVVKTLFHKGFETLERYGGNRHPFIISKLGSVVGPHDMDGIYFYGRRREQLHAIQERIAGTARFVTVLSEPAAALWRACFGPTRNVLLVPGAVDAVVPPPGPSPYRDGATARCLFAGTVYGRTSQPEANRTLIDKLNALGAALAGHGVRLYLLGTGDVRRLDRRAVTHLGAVPYARTWDYMHHANVGVVVSAGPFMHNNESSKLYHYLRAGLPVVSESGFPNEHVVTESGCGLLTPSGDTAALADGISTAARRRWDVERARRYVLENHTWDRRAATYDAVIRQELSTAPASRRTGS